MEHIRQFLIKCLDKKVKVWGHHRTKKDQLNPKRRPLGNLQLSSLRAMIYEGWGEMSQPKSTLVQARSNLVKGQSKLVSRIGKTLREAPLH